MPDPWLEERLANRRTPDDPDYDAFYDAADDELAALVPHSVSTGGPALPGLAVDLSGERPGGTVNATRRTPADHPHTDPGDGRTECQRCGKYIWPAIHSCKGIPVTDRARARAATPPTGDPTPMTTITSIEAERLATARDCTSPNRLHCAHFEDGDGGCCHCGRPCWCPDGGVSDATEGDPTP